MKNIYIETESNARVLLALLQNSSSRARYARVDIQKKRIGIGGVYIYYVIVAVVAVVVAVVVVVSM